MSRLVLIQRRSQMNLRTSIPTSDDATPGAFWIRTSLMILHQRVEIDRL
jgi:hypothetical protein